MTTLCLITSASDRLDRGKYLLATHHPSTTSCYFSRSLRCRLCCITHGTIARHPISRMRTWSLDDINMTTLKRYLGLCINTGILRKNVTWYWSNKFASQSNPFFPAVMPFRKFEMMQHFLHVGALDTPAHGQPGFDPWSKM